MATKTLILGDLHGRKRDTATVLHRAGAMDIHGNKNPDVHVIQLGDSVSLGYDELEADFLVWLKKYVDVWVLGNHELHFVWFNRTDHAFTGWDQDIDAKTGIARYQRGADLEAVQIIQQMYQDNIFVAATHVGDWLITHAGVHPKYQRNYLLADACAEDIADDLNRRLSWCMQNQGYDDVITRPYKMDGGIFWLRADYLNEVYRAEHIRQIIGHTPEMGPKLLHDNLWCIDVPAGVAGLLTNDGGKTFELIQHSSSPRG